MPIRLIFCLPPFQASSSSLLPPSASSLSGGVTASNYLNHLRQDNPHLYLRHLRLRRAPKLKVLVGFAPGSSQKGAPDAIKWALDRLGVESVQVAPTPASIREAVASESGGSAPCLVLVDARGNKGDDVESVAR